MKKKFEKVAVDILSFQEEVVRTSGFFGKGDELDWADGENGGKVELPVIPLP